MSVVKFFSVSSAQRYASRTRYREGGMTKTQISAIEPAIPDVIAYDPVDALEELHERLHEPYGSAAVFVWPPALIEAPTQ